MVDKRLIKRGVLIVAAAVAALGVQATTNSASAAPSAGVCNGGSILSGVYTSLTINDFCYVDSGPVTVTGNVTIKSFDGLFAAYGDSQLNVTGNITVALDGVLILGCEADEFACFDDTAVTPTENMHPNVKGKIVGNSAWETIIHNTSIKGDVKITGGGPGVTCSDPGFFDGAPAYSDFEDNFVGGAFTFTNVETCWSGFIRNSVVGTVTYNKIITDDPDGNELVTNKIGGDLKCGNNDPAPQVGDSDGGPNLVAGTRTGQCKSTSLP